MIDISTFQLAEEILKASRKKEYLDTEDSEYVTLLQKVIEKRHTAEESYKNERKALDKVKSEERANQSIFFRLLNTAVEMAVGDFGDIEINGNHQETLESIIQEEKKIIEKYKHDSRLRDAKEKAKNEFDKIPSLHILSEKQKKDFLEKLISSTYNDIHIAEEGVSAPGTILIQKTGREILDEITDEIFKHFSSEVEALWNKELVSLVNFNTIDPFVRLGLEKNLKGFLTQKVMLEAELNTSRVPANEKKEAFKKINDQIDIERKNIILAIVLSENENYKALSSENKLKAFIDIKADREKIISSANEKLMEIPGFSKKLSSEQQEMFLMKMFKVEVDRAFYSRSQAEKTAPFRWISAVRDEVMVKSDKQRINNSEKEIRKNVMSEIDEIYSKMVDSKLKNYIRHLKELQELKDLELRKAFELDLKQAMINDIRGEDKLPPNPGAKSLSDIIREIKVAREFEEIPTFTPQTLGTKKKLIRETVRDIKSLKKTRESLYKQRELLKELMDPNTKLTFTFPEKMQTLETYKQYESQEKMTIQRIENTVKKIFKHDFTNEDTVFQGGPIERGKDYVSERIGGFLQDPQIQGAMAGFLAGADAGASVGGISGSIGASVIGAYLGYRNPQVRHIFTPFVYVYTEIREILTKSKSYYDRSFRATVIVGASAGVIYGLLALGAAVAVLSNPIGWVIMGAAFLGAGLAVAAAAFSAKWASKKVSESVYGIADSDQYKVTPAVEQRFGKKNALRIRDYFIKEIRNFQKKIENLPTAKPGTPNFEIITKLQVLLKTRLTELEGTWQKIQVGNGESLTAWKECVRHIYQFKKDEYETQFETQFSEKSPKEIANILISVTEPESNHPEALEMTKTDKVKKEKPTERKHLTFLFKKESKARMEGTLEGIQELVEVNALIEKPTKRERPKNKPEGIL